MKVWFGISGPRTSLFVVDGWFLLKITVAVFGLTTGVIVTELAGMLNEVEAFVEVFVSSQVRLVGIPVQCCHVYHSSGVAFRVTMVL